MARVTTPLTATEVRAARPAEKEYTPYRTVAGFIFSLNLTALKSGVSIMYAPTIKSVRWSVSVHWTMWRSRRPVNAAMSSCQHRTGKDTGKGWLPHSGTADHRGRRGCPPEQLLRPDEMAMSLLCFTELARRAGWLVIPPASPDQESIR